MSEEYDRPMGGGEASLARALAAVAGPTPAERPAADLALGILRHIGLPHGAYDTYAVLDGPAGGLYVARRADALTRAVLRAVAPTSEEFEAHYLAATGRTAVRTTAPPPGVRTALRTGQARRLRLDLSALRAAERSALTAVRSIPRGQMRPVSWIAREAELTDPAVVLTAVLTNPLHLLVPCHRVAYDNGLPCDAAYGPETGDALRAAEGLQRGLLHGLVSRHTRYLGSGTTRIYCHPTCAHARRITPPHQVPFSSAGSARRAGYRPCKSCRPAAA
ncbi:MGMT family protein [Streptomyces sp. NPDC056149]|uniref:MGMT family protein n=1 Tax=Streptomyces sp. NPDC056149 TaxID=3345728 RepID=UPI0035D5C9DC